MMTMSIVNLNNITKNLQHRLRESIETLFSLPINVRVELLGSGRPETAINRICAITESSETLSLYTAVKPSGAAVLMINLNTAKRVVKQLLEAIGTDDEALVEDIVKEIGNQVLGSALSAIAYATNTSLPYDTPLYVVDHCLAIVSDFLVTLLQGEKNVCILNTVFEANGTQLPMVLILSLPGVIQC